MKQHTCPKQLAEMRTPYDKEAPKEMMPWEHHVQTTPFNICPVVCVLCVIYSPYQTEDNLVYTGQYPQPFLIVWVFLLPSITVVVQ